MDDQDTNQKVQEGEIVENQTPDSSNTNAIVLVNLEDSVKSHIASIERLQIEAKKEKETLDSVLLNDPTFQQHSEKAKLATQEKTKTRQEILKRPSVATVAAQIKNMKADIKELQVELSDYLQEYQRLSGSNIIEGEDGEIREIVSVSRVVKKSSR